MSMTTREYLNLAKPLIAAQKSFVSNYGKCLSSLDMNKDAYLYYPKVQSYCNDVCRQLMEWQKDGSLEKDMTEQEMMKEIEDA